MTARQLMTEREYLDTLANSNRFEFFNGVGPERPGPPCEMPVLP
jgi:hypothetical protein